MLKNLKVGARLALGFVLMIMMLAIISVVSIVRMQELNNAINLLVHDRYVKVAQVNDAINHVNIIARALRNMVLWGENLTEARAEEARILQSRAATTDIINALTATVTSTEGRRLLGVLNDTRQRYFDGQNRIIQLALLGTDEGDQEATRLILGSYRTQQADYIAAWEGLRTYQQGLANADAERSETMINQTITLILGIAIAAIIFAIIFAILITRSIVVPLTSCINAAVKLAKGDTTITFDLSGKDELAALQREMNAMNETIKALVADALMLSKAAVDGRLQTRADATRHQGDFRNIIQGVNDTLDAVIGPLNVAANYVERISKGDIPEKITDNYNGDFNLIKNNLNVCIDAVSNLVNDANMLASAAVDGALQTRADGSRHQGDYRRIVEGVNRTLDLVITPINETIAIMKRLAEGDMTMRITGDYKGDFDVLKTALNNSLDSINDTLSQINIAVDQVAEGSIQVSQASQALSQGATEQASSLEEITSSTTEISSQTKQNTENADKVNGLARTAQQNAEKGNVQMKDLVAAMTDINNSAEEIKKVTKTIDDISFQINLLALNANVEAARAGKYGKGFAVVAEEVRNLAVRSANSVKDTTRMVEEAITNIQRGNVLVEGTAKQLDEIVEGAAQVVALAEEVATAGREQTQGLEQISLGLNQIDQVTQSNTASAEESASASEELSSQAQQVKSMLARFKLRASENRMNNAEMIALLRSELAKSEAHKHSAVLTGQAQHAAPAAAKPKAAAPAPRAKPAALNPADIISLDDSNFGKF